MQVDWWTLVIQAINFLVLVWLLSRFLYRPVRDVIAKRQAQSDKILHDAEEKAATAEAAGQKLAQGRAALNKERQSLEAKLRKAAQDEQTKLLEAAQTRADELIGDAKAKIEADQARLLSDAKQQIVDLAAELAAQILGDAGTANPTSAVLKQAKDYFEALPDSDLAEIKSDLENAKAPISIVTPKALGKAEQAKWQKLLRQCFGEATAATFAEDPSLLGGAQVRFAHAVIDFSWSGRLRDASRQLLEEPDDA